ncbi:dCTP deaminase [bacterium]|nr:dCTP deaminase [bacterium]
MILTGQEILKELNQSIFIEPFQNSRVNPNSYNLTLDKHLVKYTQFPLDMRKDNKHEGLVIPEEGLLLEPGVLYLGRTVERTKTLNYVPMLEGRSSVGRLGMFIHVTAGFGDVGFDGFWTLEIIVTHPLIIYPNVEICQIFYHTVQGQIQEYKSKYQKNTGIQTSMMYKDFNKS